MSGFDVEAALNGLKALVQTIPAMEAVQLGAPESLSNRISAWVTVGDPGEITAQVQGVYDLDLNLIVWFGYAVEGSESAAEAQLGDYLSGLTRALIQNRMGTVSGNSITVTRNLNGAVDRMGLPQAAAGVSDYTLMAGLETRTFPVGVRVIQREALGV
jgi:hypothetical protein